MTTKLYWNNRFEMGIPLLDEQHKALFGIYLELDNMQTMENEISKEQVWEIIQRLQAYVHYHFKTEEHLMREANYQDFEKHIKLHELFARLMKEQALELRYFNQLIVENLVVFIKKWLMSHILKEDRKYMECVINHLQSVEKSTVFNEK